MRSLIGVTLIACAPTRPPEPPPEPVATSACEPVDDVRGQTPLPPATSDVVGLERPQPAVQREPESDRPCRVVRHENDRVLFERLTCHSAAYAITSDGETVGGQLERPATAFRWTGDRVVELGPGRLRALADDGTTAVGLLDEVHLANPGAAPGVWRGRRHGKPLVHEVGQGRAITPDGRYAAGFAWRIAGRNITALRWDLKTGKQIDLGSAPGRLRKSRVAGPNGENVQAGDISDDGQTVVGTARTAAGRVGFAWHRGELRALPHLPGSDFSGASACNADCTIVGGLSTGPSGRHEAVRWIEDQPSIMFEMPQGASSTNVWCMDASGNVVGGEVFSHSQEGLVVHAFLWDTQSGFRHLKDEVAKRGLDVDDWRFWSVTAMSADGTMLVGRGAPEGSRRWTAYRVVLR